MIDAIIVFLLGLAILILGSREAVLRGVRLARLTGMSEMAIGFLLLAVGTSLPELAVSLFSAFGGETQIALGTLAGANVYDMTLVLGIVALFGAVTIGKKDFAIAQNVLLVVIMAVVALFAPTLGLVFGLFCMILFGFFVWSANKQGYVISGNEVLALKLPVLLVNGAMLAVSMGLILLGAKWIVDSAVSIAGAVGIPEVLIGGFIIAAGTTLPELTISIQAVRKGSGGIALGTLVGSVVVNFGLVLGLAALIRPIVVSPLDRMWLIAVLAASMVFLWLSGRRELGWREGVGLVLFWLVLAAIVMAGWIG